MLNPGRRGDTIVEVMVAFAVFAALAIGVTVIMNRGVSAGQRSLETTLVRQQIDSQAALLRHARDNNLDAWRDITEGAFATSADEVDMSSCPADAGSLPAGSFYVRPVSSDQVVRVVRTNESSRYIPAQSYSMVNFHQADHQARGLWIVPVQVQQSGGASTDAYDMYIRACWDSVGQDRPMNLSTIVRLYDS